MLDPNSEVKASESETMGKGHAHSCYMEVAVVATARCVDAIGGGLTVVLLAYIHIYIYIYIYTYRIIVLTPL